MSVYRIYPCGDHAATIELGDRVNETVNGQVMSVFKFLKKAAIKGIRDIIPAYNTVTIVYDIASLKQQSPALSAYTTASEILKRAVSDCATVTESATNIIEIPVCYDLSLAPDIQSLADFKKIAVEDVIRLHTASIYRVYMIGFLPGFAYMGSVDEKLVMPRHATPRTKVPAGSVGIAGEQTGIYPVDSPGGWQLIGQTPIAMFRPDDTVPCYLQPGNQVKFYPVSLQEFKNFKQP